MSRYHSVCPQCKRVFAKSKENPEFCSLLCEGHFNGLSSNGLKKNICEQCGHEFWLPHTRRYCTQRCSAIVSKAKVRLDPNEKIKRANERWVTRDPEEHPLKNCKRKSFDKMINQMEYQRVFGKGSWSHYERGRKWDRI